MVTSKEKNNLKTLIICHIAGFIFVNLYAGFAHDIARAFPNVVTQVLFPINYSLGQSLKLVAFPLFIVFAAEYFIVGKKMDNFIAPHLLLVGILPVAAMTFYHTYSYILNSKLELNTLMFILLTEAFYICGFLGSAAMMTSKHTYKHHKIPAMVLCSAVISIFVIVTFLPPHTATFFDDINHTFTSIF